MVDAWGSGITNAYRARPDIHAAIERKRREVLEEPGATCRLITSNGRVVRKLRKVPDARLDGLSERFLELKHARQITPVDLDALQRLDKALTDAALAGDEERFRILEDLGQDHDFNLQAALFTLRGIIDSALTDIGGRGNIVSLPALENYLQNKNEVREGIAERTRLPKATVKRCILIVCYGGSATGTWRTQIYKEFGSSVAGRLKDDPEFAALSRDAGSVFRAVLKSLTPWRGRIWNVLELPSRPPKPGKIDITRGGKMAHILQGIEAQALYAIIRAYYDDMVLLQHDGFTVRRRLDVQEMKRIVYEETGYELELEEEVL